jgi:hypothetical protein
MAGVAGYVRRHHLGLLALFVALGGTGYAAVRSARATPTIHACASKKTGALTLARAHDRCRHGQRKVNWALKGPRGDRHDDHVEQDPGARLGRLGRHLLRPALR